MFDVDECGVVMRQYRSYTTFFLSIHQHWHEFIYHRHIYISPVVPADEHLCENVNTCTIIAVSGHGTCGKVYAHMHFLFYDKR